MGKFRYYLGIDTGTNTGVAIWDTQAKNFITLETCRIHVAMKIVEDIYDLVENEIHVRVEDARLRRWYNNSDREKLQGAGSIKRDAVIWEDFLKDLGVSFEMVAPKNNITKLDMDRFGKLTGWNERCSGHARDAAFLVFGL